MHLGCPQHVESGPRRISGERGERPELHPHNPDGGTTASTWAIPRQNACYTPRPVILHCERVQLMARLPSLTFHPVTMTTKGTVALYSETSPTILFLVFILPYPTLTRLCPQNDIPCRRSTLPGSSLRRLTGLMHGCHKPSNLEGLVHLQ